MKEQIHTDNINAEGIINDRIVETFYCPCEGIINGEGYLRVIADNGGTNVETRIAFETLIQAGWTPPQQP